MLRLSPWLIYIYIYITYIWDFTYSMYICKMYFDISFTLFPLILSCFFFTAFSEDAYQEYKKIPYTDFCKADTHFNSSFVPGDARCKFLYTQENLVILQTYFREMLRKSECTSSVLTIPELYKCCSSTKSVMIFWK